MQNGLLTCEGYCILDRKTNRPYIAANHLLVARHFYTKIYESILCTFLYRRKCLGRRCSSVDYEVYTCMFSVKANSSALGSAIC